jgi:hypothetical protein
MASTIITCTLYLFYELFAQMHRMNGLWVTIPVSVYLISSDNTGTADSHENVFGGFCSGRIFPMVC